MVMNSFLFCMWQTNKLNVTWDLGNSTHQHVWCTVSMVRLQWGPGDLNTERTGITTGSNESPLLCILDTITVMGINGTGKLNYWLSSLIFNLSKGAAIKHASLLLWWAASPFPWCSAISIAYTQTKVEHSIKEMTSKITIFKSLFFCVLHLCCHSALVYKIEKLWKWNVSRLE